jgi:hypothetical protein
VISFDERGNKTNISQYSTLTGNLTEERQFYFNDHNQLILSKQILPQDSFFVKTTFKYESVNSIEPCETRRVNSKGYLMSILKSEFNDAGKAVKEMRYYDDTTKIASTTNHVYNEKGFLTESHSYIFKWHRVQSIFF